MAKTIRQVITYRTPSAAQRAIEVTAGVFFVLLPLSVQAGVFQLFAETNTEANLVEVLPTDHVLDLALLSAATNPDPASARGGADILVQDGALVSTGPIGKDVIDDNRTQSEISVYTVRDGDTLSMIAEMFDVTANTILWANDLTSAKAIKPGDTLIILPIAGVRHVVKTGDTIASIAKKYEGNAAEIVSYNQLSAEADLVVGATVIVPGGALHTVAATPKAAGSAKSTAKSASFTHPVPGAIKTQGIHGTNAVDFGGAIGTTVRAAAAGEVIVSKSTGWNGGYGQYIVIKHRNGSQTLYAHLSSNSVGVGAMVEAGQVIGAMGNTGKSTGPHLHFEVRGARNPF